MSELLDRIDQTTIRNVLAAVNTGLHVLKKPVPLTASQWADQNFYLSSESSYSEGRWQTTPFQRAIMNAMGNDDIQAVDFIKSARVGYTKMILAVQGYMLEHKKRNQMLFQPRDAAASEFMKEHFEPMIRDVPVIRELSPWYGMKHRDSTKDRKLFSNHKQLHVKGGASAKNYREKSVDTVYYDELSGFDPNVEYEGSPTTLGDKRAEGSVFRKSIRGSTPKIKDECLITLEAQSAQHFFRRFVPCPHCDEMQTLKFGGKETHYGLKWPKGDPDGAFYCCEKCAGVIENNQLSDMDAAGEWRSEQGLTTKDGIRFTDTETGQAAATPKHLAFHIWTIYSPWTTWAQIAYDWLASQGDSDKLKTFVNVTLGEAWEEETGDRTEPNELMARLEEYDWPEEPYDIVAGCDTQDNRLEATVYAFKDNEEAYCIEHHIFPGDTSQMDVFNEMAGVLADQGVQLVLIDSQGHNADTVYRFCKGKKWIIPTKGFGGSRTLIENRTKRAQRLRKRRKGITPEPIGVDQGKTLLASRLAKTAPGPGYIHFRHHESMDDEFFQQLTAEVLTKERRGGRITHRWKPLRERNEALDCYILALAAFRILVEDGKTRQRSAQGDRPAKKSPVRQNRSGNRLRGIHGKRTGRLFNG